MRGGANICVCVICCSLGSSIGGVGAGRVDSVCS